MFDHVFEEWVADSIPPEWNLIGSPEYTESVYQSGIHNALLVATWEGKYFLMGGNRRLLSWKAARAKAEAEGTLQGKPWLESFSVRVYLNMPPVVQAAWALADNEERSDNPLHAYLTIKAAKDAGDWERVKELFRINKAKEKQIEQFGKLTPELLAAVIENRMTKNVALEAAKLGKRQAMLLEMAQARARGSGKPVAITGKDIKETKLARANEILQETHINLSTPREANKAISDTIFLVIADLNELEKVGKVFHQFVPAFAESQASGQTIFQVVKFK